MPKTLIASLELIVCSKKYSFTDEKHFLFVAFVALSLPLNGTFMQLLHFAITHKASIRRIFARPIA